MSFLQRLQTAQERASSLLCVGLDPDPARMPRHLRTRPSLAEGVLQFNSAIVEATHAVTSAYKLNVAFYEALGSDGYAVLTRTLRQIPDEKVVILDAKRGDIGNSARMYARALFDQLEADACTVSPYMGRDAVAPFLQYEDRGVFVLALTSNPGSQDFQHQLVSETPLYRRVAEHVARWHEENSGTAGLVVGATQGEKMDAVREAAPGLPFLVPGVGAQGGDLDTAVRASAGPRGSDPFLVTSSRSIIYASSDQDYGEAAGRAAERLNRSLREAHPSDPFAG